MRYWLIPIAALVLFPIGCRSMSRKCCTNAPPPRVLYTAPPGNAEILMPAAPATSAAMPPPTLPPLPPASPPTSSAYPPPAYVPSPKVELLNPDPAPDPNGFLKPTGRAKTQEVSAPPALPTITKVAEFQTGRALGFDELDRLAADGVRTVVFVHASDESDAADRRQIEQRQMRFVSLTAGSSKAAEDFIQLMKDPSARPVYVYDRDGSLAPKLWYQYFRQVESLSDEAARIRAERLVARR